MPRVKIDYELITGPADPFIIIEIIVFDASDTALADLQRDKVLAPTPGYKSKNPQPPAPPAPYWTLPDNQYVHVFVRATGQSGLSFSMTVTFTVVDATFSPVAGREPYTPLTPLLTATIVDGQGEIDASVCWRKPASA